MSEGDNGTLIDSLLYSLNLTDALTFKLKIIYKDVCTNKK